MTTKSIFSCAFAKLWFFWIILLLFCYSCSKDTADPSYHITCKVDGAPVKFNAKCTGYIEYGSGEKEVAVYGYTAPNDPASAIGFMIINDPGRDSITAGDYTDASTSFQLLGTYEPKVDDASTDYASGTEVYKDATDAGFNITNHLNVTITSITQKIIKGKFSGDFFRYVDDIQTSEKVSVTDGDFYVKIQ
jgi:hypothetical protein